MLFRSGSGGIFGVKGERAEEKVGTGAEEAEWMPEEPGFMSSEDAALSRTALAIATDWLPPPHP